MRISAGPKAITANPENLLQTPPPECALLPAAAAGPRQLESPTVLSRLCPALWVSPPFEPGERGSCLPLTACRSPRLAFLARFQTARRSGPSTPPAACRFI